MAAFVAAADLGVDYVELDVRTCRSGELVVVHDADLSRVAGETVAVADLSLAELRQIDVGRSFGPQFAGQRIPTLAEVLETLRGRVGFNVEVKEDGTFGDGTAAATGRLLASMGLEGQAIVSSFNPAALLRVRRVCRVPLGLVFPPDGGRGPVAGLRNRLLRRPWTGPLVAAFALHARQDLVSPEMLRRAHGRGMAVAAWTVDDPLRMRELAAMRVNSIITNRPDLALAAVRGMDPRSPAPG